MAKDKKGFILYADQIDIFEELSDEDAGKLAKHIFRYVNDKNPEAENPLVKLAFVPIKQQLKRDLKKYEDKCSKNTENINKRWNKKDTTVYDRIPIDTKNTDTDNDTDNDNDIDKEIIIDVSVQKTIDFISKKFGISELKHFQNYKIIVACVNVQFNKGGELFRHFKDQCWNYFIYKELSQEKKHSFTRFIGTPENQYLDGGWNAENWIKKHSDIKAKEAGIESTVYPSEKNESKKYPSERRKSEPDLLKESLKQINKKK